jgi:uncharacterized protein
MTGDGRSDIIELVHGARRVAYLSIAGVCFVFAVLGAVLPILPTTPFLLLTSYYLSRSSPRLNAALRRSRVFGPLLRDWNERGGVRRSVKWVASLVVLVVVGGTLAFALQSTALRVSLLALAMIGLCVVWRLPEADRRAPARD